MWSCQSVNKNLVYIISGVNPTVVEVDTISGVQNPLFGIVAPTFLSGFSLDELRNLLRTLGKRMGIKFTPEASEYLHVHYGGHPLLSRLVGSWVNKYLQINKPNRPIEVSRELLSNTQEDRDSDLAFYCQHIVSELKEFYPEEYYFLELLASGQAHEFSKQARLPTKVKHIKNYGLLTNDSALGPRISMPVLSKFIGQEMAISEGRNTIYKLIDSGRRKDWIELRKEAISKDIKMLEKAIKLSGKPLLFGVNSFPEGEEFVKIGVVKSKSDFYNFINILNRCFVESIENYGANNRLRQYFWNEIKNSYPALHYALHRIKVYRNDADHIELNHSASSQLFAFLDQDLENRRASETDELYFHLQQRTIDGLLFSINKELDNLS